MRKLILFLLALPLFAVPPVVSNVSVDWISHSTARITFDIAGTVDQVRIRYIAQSVGHCSGGTGGITEGDAQGSILASGQSLLLNGAAANTPWYVCPEAHNTDGWSTGAEIPVTTLPLPAIHPAPPAPPALWDSSYPDTGTGLTDCPTLSSTGYCISRVAVGCSDLTPKFRAALSAQTSHGTVIMTHAGDVCTSFPPSPNTQILGDEFALDIISWGANDINTGVSPATITFASAHGLSQNQLVTWGQRGFLSPPISNSCYFGNGFSPGVKFFVDVVSPTVITLRCGDGSNNPVAISFAGTSPTDFGFEFVPHTLVTGSCNTEFGKQPCQYWTRPSLFWVIIRSDAPDGALPPQNVRIDPSYCAAGYCTTLVDPVANVNANDSLHIFLLPSANDGNVHVMVGKVRIGPGLELTMESDPSQRSYANVFFSGSTNSDIVYDRIYGHGLGTPQRWGGPSLPTFALSGLNISLRDSYFDNLTDWHAANGSDGSQADMSTGPGPTEVWNNYFHGAGIAVHFDDQGGNLVRGDSLVCRNYFFSPQTFMHGSPTSDGFWYGQRQPVEWKSGWRQRVCGNVMDTTWNEVTPASVFVALTSVNGLGLTDTDVSNNIMKHGPGGVNYAVESGNDRQTAPPNRTRIYNNLMTDIDGLKYTATNILVAPGRGWAREGPNGGEDDIDDHNTIVGNTGQLSAFNWVFTYPQEGMAVTNNFMWFQSDTQGVRQDSVPPGSPCPGVFAEALANCLYTPSYVWSNNVMMSGDSNQAAVNGWFPTLKNSNFIPLSMNLATQPGWMNYDATGAGGDYRLKSTSPYRSGGSLHATDGSDVGVDMAQIERATGHVRFASITPIGTTTATVNFIAPDSTGCPVDWSVFAIPSAGHTPTRVADAGTTPGPHSVNLTGLPSGSAINVRIECATEQPTAQFFTH